MRKQFIAILAFEVCFTCDSLPGQAPPPTGEVVLHAIDADTLTPIPNIVFYKFNSRAEVWFVELGRTDDSGQLSFQSARIPGYFFSVLQAFEKADMKRFSVEKDLLSLHYDHAPDEDDGQSAAADRTIIESMFGIDWIREHVVAVSGAYGKNAKTFNSKSDAVMDATWNDCGGWLAGHTNRDEVVAEVARRWGNVLEKGADVWVKEGGQSDITAAAVEAIRRKHPSLDTRRIHVVQHSNWNEGQTTDAALAYTKEHTHYIKIKDANAYLNIKGGDDAFEEAARKHPVFGPVWIAAFTYYDPKERLDFSDTGELMYILGLGEIGIDDFRTHFLIGKDTRTPNRTDAGDTK